MKEKRMSTEYNASEIDRLVREGREDDERMTPGLWTTDVLVDTADHEVIAPNNRTWTPGGYDMGEDKPVAAGIARTRNNLPAMVAALSAAKAEVERLTDALNHAHSENLAFNLKVAEEINEARRQRDKAQDEITIYHQAAEAACATLHAEVEAKTNEWRTMRDDRDRLAAEVERLKSMVKAQGKLLAELPPSADQLIMAEMDAAVARKERDALSARVRELELTEEERAVIGKFRRGEPYVTDVFLALLDRLVKGGR